jgi:hypothetical protein
VSDVEWREERAEAIRRFICQRGSGYEGRIVVVGNEVSGRLWKPQECQDAFAMPPQPYAPDELEPAVERLKAAMEERLEELESGHS